MCSTVLYTVLPGSEGEEQSNFEQVVSLHTGIPIYHIRRSQTPVKVILNFLLCQP